MPPLLSSLLYPIPGSLSAMSKVLSWKLFSHICIDRLLQVVCGFCCSKMRPECAGDFDDRQCAFSKATLLGEVLEHTCAQLWKNVVGFSRY